MNLSLVNKVAKSINDKPTKEYYLIIFTGIILLIAGAWAAFETVYSGIGAWGVTSGISWGTGIVHFVWWVGIAHAGTFISAVLYMLHQPWRNSINRIAESMTLVAILCAAVYPVIHLGRAYLAFWIFPYENTRDLAINFNSPLIWDFFAIGSYLIVSLTFWFFGLLPDLALLKNNLKNPWLKRLYQRLSWRWTGEKQQWKDYMFIYRIIASLATALVVSVHSIVSMDFAVSNVHGWHNTLFPPFFVVGAVFSGFAMLQLILRLVRHLYSMKREITLHQLENINKIVLVTSLIMTFCYASEVFTALHCGIEHEQELMMGRIQGHQSSTFYTMLFFNSLFPLLFFFKKIRQSTLFSILISVGVCVGMWFERWLIVVSSLQHTAFGSAGIEYKITPVEILLFAGTLGFFIVVLLIITKLFPAISVHEILHESQQKKQAHDNT